jgi:hypothetical protein
MVSQRKALGDWGPMVADDRQPDESHEPDLDEADIAEAAADDTAAGEASTGEADDEVDLDLTDVDDAERARRAARIAQIDTSVAHPARVYDYLLGGKDNYAADREAAERVLAVVPDLRFRVRANRAFLARATRYLAGEAGIKQFLDIGTGIPSANNTHEVAQEIEPQTRVVYVDNDPIVLTHARALLASGPKGATQYVDGDLREPDRILKAATTLDFSQPIALMLFGILHLVTDQEGPLRIVAELTDALPSGSYLALSHPASDTHQGQAEAQRRYNERVSTPQQLRSHDEVLRFFEGLEFVEPGLVQVHNWRPDPTDEVPATDAVSAHGAVARKP